ncbi:MAG: helix-turn-helix domain-containing protein [Chloroflexota bacterium]|nr:helix-turn-helix domain-containing protein [Chloroflexota bacterium]
MIGPSEFITVKQFQARWKISKGLAYRLVKAGRIPHILAGKKILIVARGLDAIVEEACRAVSSSDTR